MRLDESTMESINIYQVFLLYAEIKLHYKVVFHFVHSIGAVDLYLQIPGWMQSTGKWESALREIIAADSYVAKSVTIQAPIDYFNPCKYTQFAKLGT